MNDITHNLLEENISELFGFDALADEEKAELLDNIGEIIIESAVLRFITEHDEANVKKFEELAKLQAHSEDLLAQLVEAFPEFAIILEEEIIAFKEEAKSVLKS